MEIMRFLGNISTPSGQKKKKSGESKDLDVTNILSHRNVSPNSLPAESGPSQFTLQIWVDLAGDIALGQHL